MQADDIHAALPDALARAWNAERVTLANVRPMTGGASRETWSLDATVEYTGRAAEMLPLVLRAFQPESPQALDCRAEYTLVGAVAAAGIPAPRPLFIDESLLPSPFYLMERVEGETVGRRLIKDAAYAEARRVMPAQLASTLAGIHGVPLTPALRAALPPLADGASPAAEVLEYYESTYRAVTPDLHPTFELALRWMRRHLPPPVAPVLVHGDYRIGNVIFGPEGLRSVLDWELAHAGDPMADLGWICVRSWRFGGPLPVGGIATREEFFAAYEAASGRPVDPDQVRWWEVFGTFRWGVITLTLAQTFLDGRNPGVEPASIGRRTAETEWDLLNLLEAP